MFSSSFWWRGKKSPVLGPGLPVPQGKEAPNLIFGLKLSPYRVDKIILKCIRDPISCKNSSLQYFRNGPRKADKRKGRENNTLHCRTLTQALWDRVWNFRDFFSLRNICEYKRCRLPRLVFVHWYQFVRISSDPWPPPLTNHLCKFVFFLCFIGLREDFQQKKFEPFICTNDVSPRGASNSN